MVGVEVAIQTFSVLLSLPRAIRTGIFAFFCIREKTSTYTHVLKTKGKRKILHPCVF